MTDMPDNAPKPNVTGGLIRSYVERAERLEAEASDLRAHIKAVFDEAKSQGFDPKVLRLIVRERKRDASELLEESALLDLYRGALAGDHDE